MAAFAAVAIVVANVGSAPPRGWPCPGVVPAYYTRECLPYGTRVRTTRHPEDLIGVCFFRFTASSVSSASLFWAPPFLAALSFAVRAGLAPAVVSLGAGRLSLVVCGVVVPVSSAVQRRPTFSPCRFWLPPSWRCAPSRGVLIPSLLLLSAAPRVPLGGRIFVA